MLLTTAVAVVLALPPAQRVRPAEPPAEATGAPLSEPELRARVRTLLSTIDTPVRAADWRALGPDAVPILEQVVRNPAELSSRRAQAVFGLSAIGGARARADLLETARADHERLSVRSAAIEGLPRVLDRDELVPTLGPVLRGARSPAVRAAAADVLARTVPDTGCPEVRSQLEREPPATREHFARAVSRCGG